MKHGITLDFDDVYQHLSTIVRGNTIDLSDVEFVHPWGIVMMCLLLIERHGYSDRDLILPTNSSTCGYLKRMHFHKVLREIGYEAQAQQLEQLVIPEKENLNIQEIVHCLYRDEFNVRLERFIQMFQNFGLSLQDSFLATGVVGELGNNVFDHNSFSWPTNISGSIIMAQNYPRMRCIEVAIGDPGIGFRGSLAVAFPELKSDVEAIKKGLAGNSGRVGEVRGNGLRLIQQWTLENFSGTVMVQSGDGLVIVTKGQMEDRTVHPIVGTLAQFVIHYK